MIIFDDPGLAPAFRLIWRDERLMLALGAKGCYRRDFAPPLLASGMDKALHFTDIQSASTQIEPANPPRPGQATRRARATARQIGGTGGRAYLAIIAASLIACALVLFGSTARASDYGAFDSLARGSKFGAVASFTTNYFYRGYTKSNNRPTLRGNVDFEHDSGIYAGSWLSWIDFSDGHLPGHSDLEFYPYLGYSHDITDSLRAEILVSRYIFNEDVFGRYSDYNEYSVALHYRDSATARIYFADDAYHRGKPFTTYELTGRHPILDSLEFSAGVGYNDANAVLEYDAAYWHAGVTWYWKLLAVEFRYVDSHFFGGKETPEEAISNDELILKAPDPKFLFSLNVGY
jgi:uncharacterized protein (TIGR02001 family)